MGVKFLNLQPFVFPVSDFRKKFSALLWKDNKAENVEINGNLFSGVLF